MRIGIDLGGTKIEIIALERGGGVLWRERMPTPRSDYDATIRAMRDLVAAAELCLMRRGSVGVAIPGAISAKSGLVKNANSTHLIGHPLDKDLGAALGRPVRVANDANCFALSEATDGAGRDAAVVFGIIAGTGMAAGSALRAACSPAPMELPANGATIRSRRHRPTNCPDPTAIAASGAASRPGAAARRSQSNSPNGRDA